MYVAGVSVRRVEDITEVLWGTRLSPSTVSDLNEKILAIRMLALDRPISTGSCSSAAGAGEVRNVSLLVAIGVMTMAKEDKAGWSAFLNTSRSVA